MNATKARTPVVPRAPLKVSNDPAPLTAYLALGQAIEQWVICLPSLSTMARALMNSAPAAFPRFEDIAAGDDEVGSAENSDGSAAWPK